MPAQSFNRSTEHPPPKARVGRPRAVPVVDGAGAPEEEILLAAARLFTSAGFQRSTTRQIAGEVGLRQASVFHYFKRKDDIFAELLDRTVEPALQFAASLSALEPDPAPGLYLLVLQDVANLCRAPGNLGLLQLQIDARSEPFAGYWRKRGQLLDEYRRLIERGAQSGVFTCEDAQLQTSITFGLVESVATWFSYDLPQSRHEVWQAIADNALRALLTDVSTLQDVRVAASKLGHRLDRNRLASPRSEP